MAFTMARLSLHSLGQISRITSSYGVHQSLCVASLSNKCLSQTATANTVDSQVPPSSIPNASGTDSGVSSLPQFFQRLHDRFEESSGLVGLVHLKDAVQRASEKFDESTHQVATCRRTVTLAQTAHDQAHKKHVSLLMRRDEWNADDAQAFVSITSDEVTTRQELLSAQEALKQAEHFSMQCQHAYMDIMRQRYHEEQLWQDKWRLLGTYGTWSLIGINTLVFVVGQYAMQRREMNRLHHMEQLLLQRYPKESDDQGTTAEVKIPNVTKVEEANGSALDDKDDFSSKSVVIPEDVAAAKSAWLDKDFVTVLYGVPFHTPSIALGAVVSASLIVMVSLFHRR
jgi:She9 / Mdm33 family